MKIKTALTIAGSDCSGGAGIQADLKTMTVNGVYAMSVITALTAQNTTGIRAIEECNPEFIRHQIDAIFEDIRPDAVKIGMVSSVESIRAIAERLIYHKAEPIVLDPVMISTSGYALIKKDAIDALKTYLISPKQSCYPECLSGMITTCLQQQKKSLIHFIALFW